MKYQHLLLSFLVFLSCNNESTETSNSDDETPQDSIDLGVKSDDYEENMNDYDWEDVYYDTVYYEDASSQFYDEQLDKNTLYVYWKDHLIAFEDELLTNSSFEIPKGESVKLLEKTSEYQTEDNFHGQVYKIEYEGQIGYVNSAFLSQFPHPGDINSVTHYAHKNLHLLKSIKHEDRVSRDPMYAMEGENGKATAYYESGILIINDHAWEYSGEYMKIPGGLINVEEAFLIMAELWDQDNISGLLEDQFPQPGKTDFPAPNEYEYISIDVDTDKTGFATHIEFNHGEGCGNWCSVYYEDGFTVIHFGGGC